MNNQRKFILIAASLGMAGTFMPWITTPLGSFDGSRGDGWITLVLFSIPLLISLFGEKSQSVRGLRLVLGSLFGFLAGLLGFWKIIELRNLAVDEDNPLSEVMNAATSPGFGLYLIVLCGVLLMLTSFIYPEQEKVTT